MSKSSASNNRAYRHCLCHDCKRLGLVQSEKTIRVHAQRANAVDQRVQQSKRPKLKRSAADRHEEAIGPMQMQEDSGEDESQIAQNSDEDDAYDNQQGINYPGVQQKVESAGLLQFQEEVGGDAFHHAPRDLMQGVVNILNLVTLDGGAPAPVLPTWSSFVKSMERATKKSGKKYFICPHGCKEGVSKWTGSVPKRCASCREDISITPEEVPKWILRHLEVKESLDAVLAHPDVQDYLPAGHRADMQTHLYIPDEFKGFPAWNAFVSNPNVLSLALFFDGVPCFRLVNITTLSTC
eukprot:g6118.t1